MNARQGLTAVGAGVATFLFVAVAVIELLDFEFSAIVGLPVGLIVGLGVLVALAIRFQDLKPLVQHLMSAYAAFGLAVLVQFAARYVNLGPSRDVLTVDLMLGVGVVIALVVLIALWMQERVQTDRPERT